MSKAIVQGISIILLLVALALTQVSSPDYRRVMSACLLSALVACGGFVISAPGRSRRVSVVLNVLAAFCAAIAIYAAIAIVDMSGKH